MSISSLRQSLPLCFVLFFGCSAFAAEMPKLVKQDGRYAFLVDGKPFLILGAQINNSSAWPASLPEVWPAIEAMHANTVEAPVYWEQLEPQPGKFDFSNVDELVKQAREHHVSLALLWFGTWKNTKSSSFVKLTITRDEPSALSSRNSRTACAVVSSTASSFSQP